MGSKIHLQTSMDYGVQHFRFTLLVAYPNDHERPLSQHESQQHPGVLLLVLLWISYLLHSPLSWLFLLSQYCGAEQIMETKRAEKRPRSKTPTKAGTSVAAFGCSLFAMDVP